MHIPFFRIFYSTTFTVLAVVTAVLLLLTPGNLIYEGFRYRRITSIFIVASVYVLTLIVAVLLYASRLYTNRRALVHIPKDWSPLKEGDVEKKVRKLVADKLEEVTAIAYKSRPRDLSKDNQQGAPEDRGGPQQDNVQVIRPGALESERPPETIPPWGIISHPGWSAPSSSDLPNLEFNPVIHELANLIEAKAVSLAPPDPLYDPTIDASDPPLPDALVVELLQRPATIGLRGYIAHLDALGMINRPELLPPFLTLYERARFSGNPLSEKDFRHLMAMFAEMLRGLKELDAEVIAQLRADNASLLSADSQQQQQQPQQVFSDDNPPAGGVGGRSKRFDSNNTVQHTPHQQPDIYHTPRPDRRSSISSGSEAGSEGTARTAPSHRSSRSPRARQQQRIATPSSSASLRLMRSSDSSSLRSAGSVIRLAEARTPLDLPYAIVTPSSSSQEEGL
ncbi:MAG: hypothetical protein LQ348_006932 [Seirophora lacunosa]|nr:MAG: hypothetical protein LQ348_006932 [Seirophora lacunosa]